MTTYSAIEETSGTELFHGGTSLEDAQNKIEQMFGSNNHAWIVPALNKNWRHYASHVETSEGKITFRVLATVVTHTS